HVADALRECAVNKVRSVLTITSGFKEAGDAGIEYERDLQTILKDAPFRMIGPNCQGLVVPRNGLYATFSAMTDQLKEGPVAILSQSGALSGMIANRLIQKGIGTSVLVSTGNEADVSIADLMEMLEHDEATKVILIYAEQIREANKFVE